MSSFFIVRRAGGRHTALQPASIVSSRNVDLMEGVEFLWTRKNNHCAVHPNTFSLNKIWLCTDGPFPAAPRRDLFADIFGRVMG